MGMKEKLTAQLAAIQEQLAHCSCDDDSPIFVPKRDDNFFSVDDVGNVSGSTYLENTAYENGNDPAFRTEEDAEAHAEAFDVLLELRAQKGVVPMKHGTWQYLVEARGDGSRLEVRKRRDAGVKQSRCFSPAFETEAQANAAINAVGRDNIIKAMKVLAWG
jgi:hypothetical protein